MPKTQKPRRETTIRDVAARAGVSVATISRAFSATSVIREATRARVLTIAEEMRYVPHAGARSLSMRRTGTIGVVLPDLHGEFFSEVIRGIDLAARESGIHLLVSGSHSDPAEMRAVVHALRGRVDGLIAMSPDLEPSTLLADMPHGIPLVVLNSPKGEWPTILIDNFGGAKSMVAHLASLGHRRIAFIRGPEQNVDANERLRGYRDGIRTARLALEPRLEISGNFTEESGYQAAAAILVLAPRADAIFAANDAMAIGALSALREAGISVPDNCALVGFDDIPIARFLAPPLTTVKVSIAQLGRSAFELLHSISKGNRPSLTVTLPTSLIVRESCGAGRRSRTPRAAEQRTQEG